MGSCGDRRSTIFRPCYQGRILEAVVGQGVSAVQSSHLKKTEMARSERLSRIRAGSKPLRLAEWLAVNVTDGSSESLPSSSATRATSAPARTSRHTRRRE